jgi:hypothetical protein
MIKKTLAGLFALACLGSSAAAEQRTRTADPKSMLFSLSTVADDTAPVTPLKGKASATDPVFHGGDWRQIEFFAPSREQEIRQALAAFERERRSGPGWKKIHTRKLPAQPVIAGKGVLDALAKNLGVAAGPGRSSIRARATLSDASRAASCCGSVAVSH